MTSHTASFELGSDVLRRLPSYRFDILQAAHALGLAQRQEMLRAAEHLGVEGNSYSQAKDESLFHLPPEKVWGSETWAIREKVWGSVGITDLFAALTWG